MRGATHPYRWRLTPAASGQWLVLVGPYDPAFIDDLKNEVPHEGREWRPKGKVWRIALEHRQTVERLIVRHSERRR